MEIGVKPNLSVRGWCCFRQMWEFFSLWSHKSCGATALQPGMENKYIKKAVILHFHPLKTLLVLFGHRSVDHILSDHASEDQEVDAGSTHDNIRHQHILKQQYDLQATATHKYFF